MANLAHEGVSLNQVHLVGNVMIDTLKRNLPIAEKNAKYIELGLEANEYVFVTLHRPSNVDDYVMLSTIVDELIWLSGVTSVLFTLHPRTKKQLIFAGILEVLINNKNIYLVDPLPYIDAISIISSAKVVVTDSGGLQEETSALGVPCLTLRHNTERPITIEKGTNILIRGDWVLFREKILSFLSTDYIRGDSDNFIWDGQAAKRILDVLDK